MVKKYTDLNYKVGKHFKVKEFQSKDGDPVVLIDDVLVTMLDQIRDYLEKKLLSIVDIVPLHITQRLEVWPNHSILLEKRRILL